MTRLLVLGNSHVGALRQAADAFSLLYPAITLGFFAAPGAMFRAGKVNAQRHFTARLRSDKDRDLVERLNGGTASCDLGNWDQILVVGHRLPFVQASDLLAEHDLIEGTRTGKSNLLSRDFVLRAIARQIDDYVTDLANRFGTAHRFTFTDAPFPSEGIFQLARPSEYGKAVGHYVRHPDTPWLFPAWQQMMAAALAKAGYGFLIQPDATIAGPCLTHPHFAEGGAMAHGATMARVDHRHMNREFGLAVLTAFAETVLKPETNAAIA